MTAHEHMTWKQLYLRMTRDSNGNPLSNGRERWLLTAGARYGMSAKQLAWLVGRRLLEKGLT